MSRPALIGLLLLPACAAVDTPEACRITQVTELPIRMVGNFPLVEATINSRPARLLLDTGADGLVVSEDAYARLALERDYTLTASTVGLGARSINWPSKAVTTTLGSLTLKPSPVLVAHVQWPLRDQDEVDGLLGSQMLSEYDADIDMPQGRLTLYQPRRCPNGPAPFGGPSMTLHAGNLAYKLTIPIRVDNIDMSAVVDTGASATFLNARRAKLTVADLARDPSRRATTADPVGLEVHVHRFDHVQVESETIESPMLAVGQARAINFDALLGSDYWRTRRVWLSYAGHTVTIGQPHPPPR